MVSGHGAIEGVRLGVRWTAALVTVHTEICMAARRPFLYGGGERAAFGRDGRGQAGALHGRGEMTSGMVHTSCVV
jgi:hypothetical protein